MVCRLLLLLWILFGYMIVPCIRICLFNNSVISRRAHNFLSMSMSFFCTPCSFLFSNLYGAVSFAFASVMRHTFQFNPIRRFASVEWLCFCSVLFVSVVLFIFLSESAACSLSLRRLVFFLVSLSLPFTHILLSLDPCSSNCR